MAGAREVDVIISPELDNNEDVVNRFLEQLGKQIILHKSTLEQSDHQAGAKPIFFLFRPEARVQDDLDTAIKESEKLGEINSYNRKHVFLIILLKATQTFGDSSVILRCYEFASVKTIMLRELMDEDVSEQVFEELAENLIDQYGFKRTEIVMANVIKNRGFFAKREQRLPEEIGEGSSAGLSRKYKIKFSYATIIICPCFGEIKLPCRQFYVIGVDFLESILQRDNWKLQRQMEKKFSMKPGSLELFIKKLADAVRTEYGRNHEEEVDIDLCHLPEGNLQRDALRVILYEAYKKGNEIEKNKRWTGYEAF